MSDAPAPGGAEFDRRWMALSEDERKDLARIASSGATHDERDKAELIAGLASVQIDRLKRWWIWLIAPVFAGVAVMLGDLLGAGRNYVLGIGLTLAGWGLLLWQRRQYSRALAESRRRLSG
jgi:hypothetical protein